VRAAIVQMKPAKGRYADNLAGAREAFGQLAAEPPDLVVFPEAAFTGYFLEGAVYDLALPAPRFADDLATAWRDACGDARVDLVAGFYENDDGTYYNSAIYLEVDGAGQRVVHVHRKMFLPTYGVFDEERFLSRGRKLGVFETRFGKAALLICEDAWHAIVPTIAAIKGARLLLIPSASPGRGIEGEGELSSITQWRQMLRLAAMEHGVFVLYAGLTGFEGGKGMTGSPAAEAAILRVTMDLGEIDIARAGLPLIGDLDAVLPDLLLDDELPLPRGVRDVPDR
jgi:N-carbamoylputrescine amidase